MKDFSNFIRDVVGLLIFLAGIAGIVFIFFYFLREYQAKQHSHEREMQAVQIDHEKALAIDAKVLETKSGVKKIIGSIFEKAFDVGQKFIGL
jgi:hypothetical protein